MTASTPRNGARHAAKTTVAGSVVPTPLLSRLPDQRFQRRPDRTIDLVPAGNVSRRGAPETVGTRRPMNVSLLPHLAPAGVTAAAH